MSTTAPLGPHPPQDLARSPHSTPVVAVIGNPNTGKSTLFNALTGLKQKTANYPGVTVERHTGTLDIDGHQVTLVDLPGTYSLAAQSPDEMVAIDVLLGHVEDLAPPRAVLVVVDATNLRRNLFLSTQLAELGLPLVLAVNMLDVATSNGVTIDVERLARRMDAAVVPMVATTGAGLRELKKALAEALKKPRRERLVTLPDVHRAATELCARLTSAGHNLSAYEVERALIDARGVAERRFEYATSPEFVNELMELRMRLSTGSSLAAMEAKARYDLINDIVNESETRAPPKPTVSERLDRITNHPVIGSVLFILVMATVFQAVFSWATPLMDLIDAATVWLAETVRAALPAGAISSLLVDGAIAGVGSVVIFLPQILILFAFIILLEDTGYMPRVAFMIDRLMRMCGLSGQSFIPMLSSFACAVPGIMATRVIPERRDRLATILAAPFMTCSARLPVYALLIGAFVPDRHFLGGILNLKGLVLLGLYLLGIAGGVLTALLMKRTLLRGPTPTFLIELPPYRLPNLRSVLLRLLERGRVFLIRAGTVIFSVAVVIWALAYFPRPEGNAAAFVEQRTAAQSELQGAALDERMRQIENAEIAANIEGSYLGRIGKFVAPLFAPLGWDWKVSAAVVAGFPAREVVVAVLGTIYAVGSEVDSGDDALVERLRNATWPDGRPVFTLPMAIGMLIFYAFCLQCAATIVMIRREAGSWAWAGFAWVYMTGAGYLGAMLAYQLGS
ncbi:MAG: ferrous iron transport protein B [Gammaproteobacteria bacterium]|nr:MAG: ferrous iron transport protein B [Gammaproteobacteria bacterium]